MSESTEETMMVGDQTKLVKSILASIEEEFKTVCKGGVAKEEITKLKETLHSQTRQIAALYKSKNKRAPNRAGAAKGKNAFANPIVVHSDLKNFFIKASTMGTTHPFNYEHGSFTGSDGKTYDIRVVNGSETLVGPAAYGKGVACKASKTNVAISEALKSLRLNGITSYNQMQHLFSIYLLQNNLKSGSTFHTDKYMDECLSAALSHLEKTGKFDRTKFSVKETSKIVSFYAKRRVDGVDPSKFRQEAESRGLTVEAFVKQTGLSPEEVSMLYDGKTLREAVVSAVQAENAVASTCAAMHRAHHTVPPQPKAPRAPKAEKVAGESAPKKGKAAKAAPQTVAAPQDAPVVQAEKAPAKRAAKTAPAVSAVPVAPEIPATPRAKPAAKASVAPATVVATGAAVSAPTASAPAKVARTPKTGK